MSGRDPTGIAPSIYIPLSLARINSTIDHVWSLIDEGRISEAYAIAENMIREAINQIESRKQDKAFFHTFTRMYHAAAHATSLSVRTDEVGRAVSYYQQMEYFARQAKDDTLINIALTYQGDMQRRRGDISRAITLLEAARDTTPHADKSACGNNMQLLARSYLRAKRINEFEATLKNSEKLAHATSQEPENTGNQYHLAHVYEEFAKGYDTLGQTQKALDYVALAERSQTLTRSVEMLLKVARAEILIHGGDLRNGEPLAVEAAVYTKQHGHHRRLERIYALKRYVNLQMLKYGKTELALSEALEGKIEER